jgi:hypothetical protein
MCEITGSRAVRSHLLNLCLQLHILLHLLLCQASTFLQHLLSSLQAGLRLLQRCLQLLTQHSLQQSAIQSRPRQRRCICATQGLKKQCCWFAVYAFSKAPACIPTRIPYAAAAPAALFPSPAPSLVQLFQQPSSPAAPAAQPAAQPCARQEKQACQPPTLLQLHCFAAALLILPLQDQQLLRCVLLELMRLVSCHLLLLLQLQSLLQ